MARILESAKTCVESYREMCCFQAKQPRIPFFSWDSVVQTQLSAAAFKCAGEGRCIWEKGLQRGGSNGGAGYRHPHFALISPLDMKFSSHMEFIQPTTQGVSPGFVWTDHNRPLRVRLHLLCSLGLSCHLSPLGSHPTQRLEFSPRQKYFS